MALAIQSERNSSYYLESLGYEEERPRVNGTLNCDVCVVGGGYAGLSAALHLAARGCDVVLIEGKWVGWGASGRNAGHVHPGYARDMIQIRSALGYTHARRLWDLGVEAVDLLHYLRHKHNIQCDWRPGHLTAALSSRHLADTIADAENLATMYGYSRIHQIGQPEIRSMLGTQRYVGGVLDDGGGHLNPLKLTRGLLRATISAGVRVFEHSPVLKIDPNGPLTVATCHAGIVRARDLVLATNVWLGRLVPAMKRRVLKAYTYMIATSPLGSGRAQSIIRNDVAVSDTKYVLDYFRLAADSRLLFGGGAALQAPHVEAIRRRIRRKMLRVFPQLEDVGIDYAWSGLIDLTANRLPHIGRITPHAYYAHGFSGHGITLALLAGQLLTEAINGHEDRYRVLADISQENFFRGVINAPLSALEIFTYHIRDLFHGGN